MVLLWGSMQYPQHSVELPDTQLLPVRCVGFSPDGMWLATGGEDKSIDVWDMIDLRQISRTEAHDDIVTGLAYSPDGKILVSGSD